MPHYRISYYLADGTFHSGVRESDIKDIDQAFKHYESLTDRYYGVGRATQFDCVMMSTQSPEFSTKKQFRKGPGKYRSAKSEGDPLGKRNKS